MTHISLNTFVAFSVLTAMVSISSCGSKKTEPNKETSADAPVKEEGMAEVTPEQMKTVGIETGVVEQKNLKSVVKASGKLSVPAQNKAVVNALVGGVIRKINVMEGQQVRKGQVVVTIENPDFIRLQQDYLATKDNIVYLAQEFERQRTLNQADAGIGKVYQQASSNYASEKTKLLSLGRQLQQIHISPSQIRNGRLVTQVPVLSPISGTVGKITLSLGSFTDASSPIMEIVNNSSIICDLQVFEKDIAKVRTGQKVNFTLSNQQDKQVSGQIYGINKSFETEDKAVIVHARLADVSALNLISGQYVSALIETGHLKVSCVPKEAIVKANDKAYIFVFRDIEKEAVKGEVNDKKGHKADISKYRFKMMEVVLGVEELGFVELKELNPMQAGAKIVTKGAFYLYSSMQGTETDDL